MTEAEGRVTIREPGRASGVYLERAADGRLAISHGYGWFHLDAAEWERFKAEGDRLAGGGIGPRPFRIRIGPDRLATVDRPASLADDRSETVADTLGNRWHLAPPPEASCSNCGADLTWSWDTSAWARADEPERGREICQRPDGTWKPHVVRAEAATAAEPEG